MYEKYVYIDSEFKMTPARSVLMGPVTVSFSNFSRKWLLTHVVCTNNFNFSQRYHKSTSSTDKYDIIITGGGLVGTAMACALGSSNVLAAKKILLLEGAPAKPITLQDKFSNRVSAINHSSVALFQRVGVWNDIKEHRVQEVRKMQVWDASSDALITFSNDDMSEPIAYIIENDLMLWALTKRLQDLPNVSIRHEAKVNDYVLPKSSSEIPQTLLENGEKLYCDLLIGADGVNSKVRSRMDTKVERTDYKQMGVVATLSTSESTNNIVAWQRFLPDGVIALLPLSDSMSSLVWSTTPEQAKSLLSLSDESFVDAVNDAFFKRYTVSPIVKSLLDSLKLLPGEDLQLPPSIKEVQHGSRAAFPLGATSVSRYVNRCVALIGDAAHRVHPLAGQGVNIGFGDVCQLSHQIEQAVYQGSHIGEGHHLNAYQSKRLLETVPKTTVIHLMQSLYKTTFTPVVALRSLGLSVVHSLPILKNQLIKRANL